MRKILIISLMVICMIFNITACGVKSNNTSKSPLRQTKDMAENVYDAIKNHDSEQLKDQFCERLQPGKETAVDKIYEYIDGEIETLETDFETDNYADTGGEKNREDKLSKGFSFGIYVVSDVYSENDWKLGWEGNDIKRAVGAVIDMIIESIR